jgi:NodT family efflux transporter outer membrane factor (OMF) lipoprotein
MNRFLSSASVAMLALAASGCATPVPQALTPADVPAEFTAPIKTSKQVWPQADWWKSFDSPELAGFVETAQANNLDLAAAYARVLQAEARSGVARSAFFPQIGLSAGATHSGANQKLSLTGTGPSAYVQQDRLTAGLDASYQLDLFGQNRANFRAAQESLRSSRYAQQVVALTVEANTANAYLNVLALRERLQLAHRNVDAANSVLKIIQAKVDNGVASNLDLAQEQAQVAGQKAQIPVLEQQEREARYALALLLGRVPEGLDVKAKNMTAVSAPVVVPGMPSELLARRPDVAEAEAALASAHANVDAARAAFFPNISLSASGGFASAALGSLFQGSSMLYSAGAQLLQTIFDGGLLASESDLAKAQQLELIANYRSAVLNAFSDTETALGRVSSLAEQERLVDEQVRNATEAFRISQIQYREGVADLLAVLQAQQTLFTSEDTLAQIRLAQLQASVGLYAALGGGWVQEAEANTQIIPTPKPVTPVSAPAPAAAPTPAPQQP